MPVGHQDGRARGVRRPRRDRPGLLRHRLLRRAGHHAEAVRAAGAGDGGRAARSAIGRFVMRNKQYTAAIRAEDGRLVMSTLAYADEVIDPAEIDELQGLDDVDVSAQGGRDGRVAGRVAGGRLRAGEVPRRVPRAGARPDPDQGIRSGVHGARGRGREAEGRRPDGGARGERRAPPRTPAGATRRPQCPPRRRRRSRPRSPRAKKARCTKTAAKKAAAKKPAATKAPAKKSAATDGARAPDPRRGRTGRRRDRGAAAFSLSNLDKVLYPSGFTKAQVIDYMARIAPVAVPHLHRPGADVPAVPRRHRRQPASSRSAAPTTARSGCRWRSGRAIGAAGSSTAASPRPRRWCGRRTWRRSRSTRRWRSPRDLDTPRAVVFDFDPGAPATIVECCEIALAVRDVLGAVGLEGWCKTSGLEGPADVRAAQHRRA